MASGLRRARPGEALVPGRVARLQRIDLDGLAAVVDDRPLAIRVAAHQLGQLRVQPQHRARPARPGGERAGETPQPHGVGSPRPTGRRLHQRHAAEQLDLHRLARFEPLGQVPGPGLEPVDPGAEAVAVAGQLGHGEAGLPAIVAQGAERRLGPHRLSQEAVLEHAADGIVPVGEHVRLDQHRLPHHTLDRVAAGVNLRRDVLDHDPGWRQRGRREERVL